MQGLVLYPDGHYQLDEVAKPKLGDNPYAPQDVLLEVKYTGVCGSDVHMWDEGGKEELFNPESPVVGGHEVSAVVKDVGQDVKQVEPGDRVVAEIVTHYCGRCVNCKQGRINICANMNPMSQRIHYTTGGGFASYAVWPAESLHKLPEGISSREGVLMEPTAGSVHTIIERIGLQGGDSVAILGPGARGQILLQICRALGASPVVVTGIGRDQEARLPRAKQFGADRALNVEEENLVEVVDELTAGTGMDVVIENTGAVEAVNQAIHIARSGGKVLVAGGGIRGGVTVPIDTRKIIVKELDLIGEISHVWTSWRKAMKFVEEGKVDLKPLVQDVYPLNDWERAFDLAASSEEVFRVALAP